MLHVAGQSSRELAELLGIDVADARRILGAVVHRGKSLAEARNLRRTAREKAVERLSFARLDREKVEDAADGFRKYLFALPDGARIETVRIPLFDTHYTMCVSSQAGCALGCVFCATGRMGLTRSLESWEIVAQYLEVRDDSSRPVTGVVFMGQGEPFANYDAVLRAAYVLCDPSAGRLDARRISISTAGVVPMIRRYTRERHRFNLRVSLNAAMLEKRLALMPIEKGNPLDELVDAIREHAAVRSRITVEYVMISGVNVGEEDAAALGRLLSGIKVRLNPIEVNDATGRFRPPTAEEWRLFRAALDRELPGQPIVRRYSGGGDRHAACGMLSNAATE
jgi:23S rRNA (adenine2503-C2)-methyltransferase